MPIKLTSVNITLALGLLTLSIVAPWCSVRAEDPSPAYLLGARLGWALQNGGAIYRFEENQQKSALVEQLSTTRTLIGGEDPAVHFLHKSSSVAALVVAAVCPSAKPPPPEVLIQGGSVSRSVLTMKEPGSGADAEIATEPGNPEPLETTATPTPITDFVGSAPFASLTLSGASFIAAIKPIQDPARLPAPGPEIYDYLVQHGIFSEGTLNDLAGEGTIARIGSGGATGEVLLSQEDLDELAAICAARSKGSSVPSAQLSTQLGKGVAYALTTPPPPTPRPLPSATPSPTPTDGPTETPDPNATPDSGFAWVCYEGKTFELPPFLIDTYLKEYGATLGKCK